MYAIHVKRTTVFLDDVLKQNLEEIAELEDRPVARIIRQALEKFVDEYKPKKERNRKQK